MKTDDWSMRELLSSGSAGRWDQANRSEYLALNDFQNPLFVAETQL